MKIFNHRINNEETTSLDSFMFSRDRENIAQQLQIMTCKTLDMTKQAIDAIAHGDVDKALDVVTSDNQVDRLEIDIENLCLRALALRQPVREDLRFVFSVLKTITDLERIGDQAVSIASCTKSLAGELRSKSLEDLLLMTHLATQMVYDAVQALLTDGANLALDVWGRDKQVDQINRRIHSELLSFLCDKQGHSNDAISKTTDLILVSRNVERIGDHGSNIAERAYYTATGERIKKQCQHNDSFDKSTFLDKDSVTIKFTD